MKITKCFTLIALLGLHGCGFHLRNPHPGSFDAIELQVLANCPKFENQLRSYLQSYNIKIYEHQKQDKETNDYEFSPESNTQFRQRPLLKISCPSLTQQPLVYDGEGQLRRERLTSSLSATINYHKNIELEVTREHQLNSNQSLADNAEKVIIISEMQDDLFYKLLTHMAK
tara:strand:- start:5288 stop:5800 length:513 start_codon:yes stop_codon:yes gene_type:complete